MRSLPIDGRLGNYGIHVAAAGKTNSGKLGSGSFTVAEYRAPTFRVDLLAGKSEIFWLASR